MKINKLTRTPVGADLSRTPPIYRPWLVSAQDNMNNL